MLKFLLVSCAVLVAMAVGVQGKNDCGVITFPNSSSIDLSNVNPEGYFPQLSQIGVGGGKFDWGFSICDSSQTPAGGGACAGGSFVTQSACSVTFPTMSGAPVADASGITFKYTSTSASLSWVATVKCACGTSDALTVPSGSYDASQPTTSSVDLAFTVSGKQCCIGGGSNNNGGGGDGGSSNGITWGGVFLILFFVPLGLYVIGFVAWNYKQGMSGRDLAPHPDFWGSLPGLFKDGITFTWSKIRGTPWESCESGAGGGGMSSSGGTGAEGSSGAASGSGYTTV